MLIRTQQDGFIHPLSSEITEQASYANRRQLLRQWSAGAAALGMGSWAQREAFAQGGAAAVKLAALPATQSNVQGAMTVEKATSYKDATTYNNFYEFGVDKSDPARNAHTLKTAPWTIEVEGLVKKPTRFNLEDVMKWGAMQERIYRMRCVEGWSMVIPWIGYSLSDLIKRVEPLPGAKYLEFVTQADPQTMPGLRGGYIDWPYLAGLRMDEAMHPLSLLTFGMYGEVLPKQNGAPVRLVVPWKYGFKSGKSIVKIRFVEKQPVISWAKSAPQEYGFFSNVNPTVDHPRWSQASERRIGEGGLLDKKRKTLMFNGYEAQVASLYTGMDLAKNF
jgi:sulfoxide reductase catalytic subunit YedY